MASAYHTTLTVLCALWTLGFVYLFWARLRVPQFERFRFSEPEQWPLLSIVIPACNEAANIEAGVESVLAQDYPNFELILIDDRSTDGTGEIIDRLARRDRRIRSLHVKALPDGWLGKVHALDRGVQIARGEWFLFTDADVHFAAGTLRLALGWAGENSIDHLGLAPLAVQKSFLLDIVVHTFMLLFLLGTRAAGINRPTSRAFVGVGAFNLVRRSAFQRTPGFSWLRLEPCDDVGLGMMVKRAGGRSFFAFAQKHLSVIWYPSVAAMFKGLEKNLFGSTANYHWWAAAGNTFALIALAGAPALAILESFGKSPDLLFGAGIIAVAAHWTFSFSANTQGWRSRFSLLFVPLGLLIISAMMVQAASKCLLHGGIDWRGTRYPLKRLRAGQRVKLLSK